jgi:hypothetical protein
MKPEQLISLISRWGGTMKFFPSGADERIGIAEEIASFASNLDQVKWLVSRLPKLYKEWPGLREVRAVFCSKFKPRDGFDVDSDVYLDGVPSDSGSMQQIAAPAVRYLPAPEEQPMNPAVQRRMEQLVEQMKKRTWVPKQAPYPTAAEIQAVKEAQEKNRKRHEALCDLARSEMAEGVYGREPSSDASCETPVAVALKSEEAL